MFEILVASGPHAANRHGWSARACSLFVHCAVIGAATLFSQRPPAGTLDHPMERPVFLLPAPRTARPAPSPPTMPVPGHLALPLHLPTVFELPHVIPPVADPAGVVRLPGADSTPGVPLQIGLPGTIAVGASPLDAHDVDEQPVMISYPAPRYPEILRQAGLEGRVLVEAVLDTAGRAEPASLRVMAASHELFADQARQVVLASRFRPGRVAGRAVRVRIQIPVTFSIRR